MTTRWPTAPPAGTADGLGRRRNGHTPIGEANVGVAFALFRSRSVVVDTLFVGLEAALSEPGRSAADATGSGASAPSPSSGG